MYYLVCSIVLAIWSSDQKIEIKAYLFTYLSSQKLNTFSLQLRTKAFWICNLQNENSLPYLQMLRGWIYIHESSALFWKSVIAHFAQRHIFILISM